MKRYLVILGMAALIAGADQLTKKLVVDSIPLWSGLRVTDFFNMVHFRNSGAAFGLLNQPETTWQFWFFMAASIAAAGIIFYLAKTADEKNRLLHSSLGFILGGAAGNFIDRVRFRNVVDFLDFHLGGWHWPAFNLADISICVGVGLLLLTLFAKEQKRKA